MKFEGAAGAVNIIEHSSIHSGDGIGLWVERSAGITIENTTIAKHVEHGVWITASS